jgi:hypothetical protein
VRRCATHFPRLELSVSIPGFRLGMSNTVEGALPQDGVGAGWPPLAKGTSDSYNAIASPEGNARQRTVQSSSPKEG